MPLCFPGLSVAADAAPQAVLLPAGTPVALHVVAPLSSGRAKPGDTFEIEASRDVVVDGLIVVRSGAGGQGTIGEVDHAGGNGHSGALKLTFNWI